MIQTLNLIIGYLIIDFLSINLHKKLKKELVKEINHKKNNFFWKQIYNTELIQQLKFFLKIFIKNLELIERGSNFKSFNFRDCSLVNCIYAGAFIHYKRNIEFASLEIEKLFNLTGSVIPTSLENKNSLNEKMEKCFILKLK